MNLQMTLKTFPATLKMMLPTGPQQLTKYICLVYFLFDVSFFFLLIFKLFSDVCFSRKRTLFLYYLVIFLFLRFWASVEPYCADITNEEVRLLEELLKPPEDEADYFKV